MSQYGLNKMSTVFQDKKIVLVHDWLVNIGGADRVLKSLHKIFPQAPIYTLFYDKKFAGDFIPDADIRSSHIQKLFSAVRSPRTAGLIAHSAIESLDFSEYDIVISSSVIYSKAVILRPKAMHICYCYSPTRQIWDYSIENNAYKKGPARMLNKLAQHLLRLWDKPASARPDYYIAISEYVKNRIEKYYRRDSRVIYPPVSPLGAAGGSSNGNDSGTAIKDSGYFLIVSRLYKHKNIDIAINAFNKLGWKLIIIGTGPEYGRLKSIAEENVKLVGYRDDASTAEYYKNCEAFIMPQEEDFGISPIEAMCCGKPVVALKKGGALEYLQEGVNCIFFDDPTEASLANALRIFNEHRFDFNGELIRASAEFFSEDRFQREIKQFIVEKLYEFNYRRTPA